MSLWKMWPGEQHEVLCSKGPWDIQTTAVPEGWIRTFCSAWKLKKAHKVLTGGLQSPSIKQAWCGTMWPEQNCQRARATELASLLLQRCEDPSEPQLHGKQQGTGLRGWAGSQHCTQVCFTHGEGGSNGSRAVKVKLGRPITPLTGFRLWANPSTSLNFHFHPFKLGYATHRIVLL